MKSRTWKKSSRKLTFRRRQSLSSRVSSLHRRLSQIPKTAVQRAYDVFRGRLSSPVGAADISGLGGVASSAITAPYSFTSSPLDPYLLTWNIFNGLEGTNGTIGTTRVTLHNWWARYRFYNPQNFDVRLTCYTLYCTQDVPVVIDYSQADDLIDGGTHHIVPNQEETTFQFWYNYTLAGSVAVASGSNVAIQSLTQVNPSEPATSGNTTPCVFHTQPGWRLNDNPVFRKHFKIMSQKTRVIHPGQTVNFIKKSGRTRHIHTGNLVDAVDSVVSNVWGLKVLAFKTSVIYVWGIECESLAYAATPGSPTLPQSTLNWMCETRLTATNTEPDQDQWFVKNALPGTATSDKIMQDNTLASVAPAIAQ